MNDNDWGLIPPPDPEAKTGPFPLPDSNVLSLSRRDIVSVLPRAPKLYNNGNGIFGVRVSRINQDIVVKYGSDVGIHEARNTKYAGEHSEPVPQIYDFWEEVHEASSHGERQSVSYIVMQHIEGDLLSEIWTRLNENVRRSIDKQILDAISKLHSLTSENPGPVGGGPSEGAFFTDYGAGPFSSRADIESWFNERLLVCQDCGIATQTTPFTGRFEHLVMCHGDLHLRNMILDRHGKLWFIDWADAGYYPAYFEIAVMLCRRLQDVVPSLLNSTHMESWREDVDRLSAIGFALTTGAFNKPRNQSILHEPKRPASGA